jgi:hypothetical protein
MRINATYFNKDGEEHNCYVIIENNIIFNVISATVKEYSYSNNSNLYSAEILNFQLSPFHETEPIIWKTEIESVGYKKGYHYYIPTIDRGFYLNQNSFEIFFLKVKIWLNRYMLSEFLIVVFLIAMTTVVITYTMFEQKNTIGWQNSVVLLVILIFSIIIIKSKFNDIFSKNQQIIELKRKLRTNKEDNLFLENELSIAKKQISKKDKKIKKLKARLI